MFPDIRDRLDTGPMTRFQCIAIGVCVLLNVLDGFDVLAMAFTSSSVSAEWDLSGTVLGLLLSAGLVGMAIGSLVLAPLADSIGRKRLILACLAVSSATMLLSAAAQSAGQLGLLRVLTGIGIGGILANSNVISGELASRRWRGLAVSLNSTGYAIGATIGGLAAVLLVDTYGWRSVFLLGGVCTAALIPIAVCALPEWWPTCSSGNRPVRSRGSTRWPVGSVTLRSRVFHRCRRHRRPPWWPGSVSWSTR